MASSTATEVIKSAKKPHMCSWCWTRIAVGETYLRWRFFDGGDAGTVKMHADCNEAMHELSQEYLMDGFSPGDNPRGCNCGFTQGCERCAAKTKTEI